MKRQVSVVIPCWNMAPYVAEAVRSAAAQRYEPLEIICVDDGSTDDTLEVLHVLNQELGRRLRIISLGENAGAPTARNVGLRASSGEYTQFLDADDWLGREKIAHQMTLVEQAEAAPDLVAGASLRVFPNGKTVPIRVTEGDVWLALISSRLGYTCSNLWRTSAVRAVGGWKEGLRSGQEADLMFRMTKAGASVVVDQSPLTFTRMGNESISTRDSQGNSIRRVERIGRILEYLDDTQRLTDQHVAVANDIVFSHLRRIYARDPVFARRLHKTAIREPFVPRKGVSTAYRLLYQVLGFGIAQRASTAWGTWHRRFKLPALRNLKWSFLD